MTAYIIRRLIQAFFVVIAATIVIFLLLNAAPGGPLSGLRIGSTDAKERVSEAQIRQLENLLGIDKPIGLQYLAWVIGDDWMGADWMYAGLERYPASAKTAVRFWVDPGVAHIKPNYDIWVRGTETTPGEIHAVYIEAKPRGQRPDDMLGAKVEKVLSPNLEVTVGGTRKALIITTPETAFVIPGVDPRPEEGSWINISGLTGAYGLLGQWAGYHGEKAGVARMDWGTSWSVANGQPVSAIVESRLSNTLVLMISATLLSLFVGIPIGVYSAVHQYSKADYAITTFSFFGTSMPVFWFGMMMILVFSYGFRGLGLPFMPAGGVESVRPAPEGSLLNLLGSQPGDLIDRFAHVIMPTIVLSLLYLAGWSRFTRSSMLEVLRQDYVRTARAKGLRERIVVYKHALRNALIPVVTVVVLQIPGIFAGAILTETVFNYKGMGRLYFESLGRSDWPLVMIILLIFTVLTVLSTLLGDILYTMIDPRIRFH
ncbi:MAG TPA: ABC transporter permease subunit [Anaerolineae bacterium]|nr:ABC transporter permease subunit [Anaerolineae bacterium]